MGIQERLLRTDAVEQDKQREKAKLTTKGISRRRKKQKERLKRLDACMHS